MSIGRSDEQSFGVEYKTKKKPVDVKRLFENTVKKFSDNTLSFITGITIVITGMGEIIGEMSIRWYVLSILVLCLYAIDHIFLKEKVPNVIFKEDKK